MDRPLKHLINGIKDATSLRDRDDWEVWASLFPDIATLAEATRRSATTNRGNLPPDRLRAQLLKSNHMPGGGKQELADTVQELLRATRGATATPLALELEYQFTEGWRLCGCEPTRFCATFADECELGFLLSPGFEEDFAEHLAAEYPEAPHQMHALFWDEFETLRQSYETGLVRVETRARGVFLDMVGLLVLGAVAGPDTYLEELGYTAPSSIETPANNDADRHIPNVPKAQLQEVVITGTNPLTWHTVVGSAVACRPGSETRIGRSTAWVGTDGALTTSSKASRQHAVVFTRADGTWMLADVGGDGLGSKHGTLVVRADGSSAFRQGDDVALSNGDLICLAPIQTATGLEPRVDAPGAWRFELLW